jgi:multidrug efflux system membrane fusion protein
VSGAENIVTAKPVVVTQQNEHDAVIASGLSPSDRVVTTGFANLSDGAKVIVGKDEQTPAADLAPRKRSRTPDAKGGQGKERQSKYGQPKYGGPRGKLSQGEGYQKAQTGPAAESSGGAAKSQP